MSFVFIYEKMQHQMSVASGVSGVSRSVLNVALNQMAMLKGIQKQTDER